MMILLLLLLSNFILKYYTAPFYSTGEVLKMAANSEPLMTTSFVSVYNTESTKYTGPYAIVTYEGPKITNPGPENNNLVMHTNNEEPVGKVLFANGASYEGGFKIDMMHGHGVLKDPTGSIYDGEWVEDRREGMATFTTPYSRYTGLYLNNKRHGRGREEDTAGNIFEGEFVNGDAVSGTMTYSNGDVYIGQMKDDDRSGYGKFTSSSGVIQEGLWEEDEFVGDESADDQ